MFFNFIKILFINIFLALSTLIPQDSISIGLVDSPQSLLPSKIQTNSEKIISNLIFRSLFKYSEGELIPDLIDDWSVNDENTEYLFKLKPDLRWQDGTPITSNDIIYSLSRHESLINEIEIEKVSDREVKIKVLTPLGILPALLTFGIEPAHLPNQSDVIPIGSTSYRISRVIREKDSVKGLILQSFGGNKQYSRIYFNFYNNESEVKSAYKLGEITSFLSSSPFNYPGLVEQNVTYLGRYFVVVYNSGNAKLSDVENRAVLTRALDVNSLISQPYYANSSMAEGPISNSIYTKEEFKTSFSAENVSLNSSQQNVLGQLTVLVPNNPDGRQIENFLRRSWEEKLGIDLEIIFLNLEDLVNEGRGGSFDAAFVGHEVTPDPDRYIFWHSSQDDKLNFSNFDDLRADKALEEGRQTFNVEERAVHYNIFQDAVLTKFPAAFLYHPGAYLYTSEKTPIPLPKVVYTPVDVLENL